jgi:dolichyl-phosphate-mannose--protein O-mannosyl transferase
MRRRKKEKREPTWKMGEIKQGKSVTGRRHSNRESLTTHESDDQSNDQSKREQRAGGTRAEPQEEPAETGEESEENEQDRKELVPGKETKRNGADSGKRKRSKPTQTL